MRIQISLLLPVFISYVYTLSSRIAGKNYSKWGRRRKLDRNRKWVQRSSRDKTTANIWEIWFHSEWDENPLDFWNREVRSDISSEEVTLAAEGEEKNKGKRDQSGGHENHPIEGRW